MRPVVLMVCLLCVVGCAKKKSPVTRRRSPKQAARAAAAKGMGTASPALGSMKPAPKKLDALFDELVRREHWKDIDPNILHQVFDNANGDEHAVKDFIYISDQKYTLQRNLVQDNYVRIACDPTMRDFGVLTQFSLTLYRLGSGYLKLCEVTQDEEQIERLASLADKAFRSSVLCDRSQFSSYLGLVITHASLLNDSETALMWCRKYKKAETELLNTADEKLSHYALAAKEEILDPRAAQKGLEEMRQYAPDILTDEVLEPGPSIREMIHELEKELLQQK